MPTITEAALITSAEVPGYFTVRNALVFIAIATATYPLGAFRLFGAVYNAAAARFAPAKNAAVDSPEPTVEPVAEPEETPPAAPEEKPVDKPAANPEEKPPVEPIKTKATEKKPEVGQQAKQHLVEMVNKIATLKSSITNKKHLAALDKLVNELNSASEAYWAGAQTTETFAKFETQCKQALSDGKAVLGQEFGFWNSIMLPILNGIIKALDIIGKAVCLVAKKHSPTFFKPVATKAQLSFEAMKIESDVEDELNSARPPA